MRCRPSRRMRRRARRDRSAAPASVAAAPETARAAAEYHAVDGRTLEEPEIIRLHARTVKRIATRLEARLPAGVQLDDLMQAGFIAVLRAVRRGSVTPDGIPPLVLQRIISNAMIDEARRQTWAPVRTVRLAQAAGRAMRLAKQRLGRDGTDEEIAAAMNLPLGEYHALLVEIAGIRLLDLDAFRRRRSAASLRRRSARDARPEPHDDRADRGDRDAAGAGKDGRVALLRTRTQHGRGRPGARGRQIDRQPGAWPGLAASAQRAGGLGARRPRQAASHELPAGQGG